VTQYADGYTNRYYDARGSLVGIVDDTGVGGTTTCSSFDGNFAHPPQLCLPLSGLCPRDAGAPAANVCADGGAFDISASHYDQSCANDADCVAIGVGNACDPCVTCPNAAIAVSAYSQYVTDVTRARPTTSGSCDCPPVQEPCCIGGKCSVDKLCFGAP
jgi:hypothetical protein